MATLASSQQSPPAFSWDDWYASVGGRSISIDEVNAYLKDIYEDQYKRFEGEPAAQKHIFANEAEAAATIKKKAAEFGGDIVGICEIEPSDIYRGKTVTENMPSLWDNACDGGNSR
jgi:hypothetical protein